jgi:radical SAM superfamily enzyme with C-terminal helix-hairpin-helix motif
LAFVGSGIFRLEKQTCYFALSGSERNGHLRCPKPDILSSLLESLV